MNMNKTYSKTLINKLLYTVLFKWSVLESVIFVNLGVARSALGALAPPGRRKKLGAKFTGKVVSAPPRQSKSPFF